MSWRVARSLDKLLDEINRRSPNRSKKSDGGIGNAEHASRDSDHNPWVTLNGLGIVTARDFTHDPDDGFDAGEFADWLRKRCRAGSEHRVKYIISNRRIASATKENWAWRPYTGPNAHQHHVHVSVLSTPGRYDDERSWGWVQAPATEEDDMSFTDKHKVTAADVAAWGPDSKYSVGEEVSYDELLRFPPSVERLRRETADRLDRIEKLLKSK